MLRSILAASLLAVSFPTAAEALNYNIVEFSESAGVEAVQDTMSARFQVTAEGRDKNAVNAEFVKKFNNFTRKSKNGSFKTELVSRSAMPRYQYTNGRRIQTGWEERAEFKVEGRDFDALNRLLPMFRQMPRWNIRISMCRANAATRSSIRSARMPFCVSRRVPKSWRAFWVRPVIKSSN